LVIVTNKYPHQLGFQPSMVEGSDWLDIACARRPNLASIAPA